jgi:TRAP-type C4-dicarboxylate transport system substrate-binding protein
MKKLLFIPLSIILITVLVLAGCGESTPAPAPSPTQPPTPTPAPAQTITPKQEPAPTKAPSPDTSEVIKLSFAFFLPPTSSISKGYIDLFQEIEDRAGGRLKIDTYWAGALLEVQDIYSGVAAEIADIGHLAYVIEMSAFSLQTIGDTPGLGWPAFEDDPYCRVRKGVIKDLEAKFPEMQKPYERVKYLWGHYLAPSVLYTHDALIRTPGDLKGKKLSASGAETGMLEALGAVPVSMAPTEGFMAMERGLVIGRPGAIAQIETDNMYDLITHVNMYNFGQAGNLGIMNMETWNNLPPDIQAIFTDPSTIEFYEEVQYKYGMASTETALEKCKEAGVVFTYPTPEEAKLWDEALKPVHEAWIKDKEDRGLPGREILEEAKSLIQQYVK